MKMADTAPAWLGNVFRNVRPGHSKLAIARFADEKLIGKGGFKLTSAAFGDNDALDPCFTADEEDSVAPPLEWTPPPPGAQEIVLIVEDPDALENKSGEPFCHWIVWGLPGQRGQILEGEVPQRVGKNSFGNSEWLLPDPPTGADPHDYVFQIFALELPLTLMPGASREDLFAEMRGNVMAASVLTANYAREEGGDYDWEDEDDES